MELHDNEEIVDLQYKGLKLIQNDKVFKFGTDAVLLSSFVTIKKGETLVDLGTGSGIIPILLSGRADANFYGIEIQEEAARLAERNAALNGKDNITIINDDLSNVRAHIERADVVTVNPPYDKLGSGEMQKEDHMQIAFYEVRTDLERIAQAASSILPTGGRLYMIHRSYRMAEIIDVLKRNRLEPKEIRPIAKKYDAEPRYILIKALKDAKEGMRLLPSLILYREDGTYTDEMRRIYHMETFKEKNMEACEKGKLYIVSTPIGNMEDITYRAVRILKEVSYIAAEDTRHSRMLLNRLGIENRLVSFHEYSSREKAEKIVGDILEGNDIALITDAGTPIISDPGVELTKLAADKDIEILSVPGPCAAIAAMTVSALDARRQHKEGHAQEDNGKRVYQHSL